MALERFTGAQRYDYDTALTEIKSGKKRSHWMWYIFPQIQGLGLTEISRNYAINDIKEATDYLAHYVLGPRLIEMSKVLLDLPSNNAFEIFGTPDNLKLKSSMTLFEAVPGSDPVFGQVLEKFFDGMRDERTLSVLKIN